MACVCPLLMLFPQEDDTESKNLCFFNLADNKVVQVESVLPQNQFQGVWSSLGWLVFLDQSSNLYLLNPLSGTALSYFASNKDNVMEGRIVKVVLSSDPLERKNAVVITIYSSCNGAKLAYRRCAGEGSWEAMESVDHYFCDIVYLDGLLFALSEKGCVQVWDFVRGYPRKIMLIGCSYPRESAEALAAPCIRGLCFTNMYLVESDNELLMVVRVIGDFVDGQGKAVSEADLLTEEDTHPLVCPYRTLFFQVFRLDWSDKSWTEVQSLGGRSLFLGGNESESIPVYGGEGCRENCIYFTDDCWERMDEDYLYGGHDMGVFSLEDRTITPFYDFHTDKIIPPPVWVLHHT